MPYKFNSHIMKIGILLLFSIFLLSNSVFPQPELKSETITGNRYALSITLPEIKNYTYQRESTTFISFPGFQDEGKPGEFILPAQDIFIAVPQNSNPSVKVLVNRRTKINAYPEINPKVRSVGDSLVIYEQTEPVLRLKSAFYEVKGYLWIDNIYCLHLKVYVYSFDPDDRYLYKNENINIILQFDNQVSLTGLQLQNVPVNELIVNKKFAASVYSKKPEIKIINSDDWIDYSKTYLKFGIYKDGIYRITSADLSAFGINTSAINPKTFKVYLKGREIPVFVSGEDDFSFDESDFIELPGIRNYGKNHREINAFNTPYNEFLNLYSDTTIYWLTWEGGDGKRITTVLNTTGTPAVTLDYYDEFIHTEQNFWFDFSTQDLVRRMFPEWTENETWNWWTQGVGTQSKAFVVSDLYPGRTAHAYVKVQSYAGSITTNTHNMGISINDDPAVYDSGYFNQYEQRLLTAEFNSDILSEGSNEIKVISYQTSSTINSIFGDWYEVEYPRYLRAVNDSLNFQYLNLSAPAYAKLKITDISDPQTIVLYKFVSDSEFVRIDNYVVNGSEITFNDTVKNGIKYFLETSAGISSPKYYYVKQFTNLRSPDHQADYILITHPKFIAPASDYTSIIESEYGYSTEIVNVFDIYDEFNYGFYSPEPIKDFLISTHQNWMAPAPEFVLIVGDANYDYYSNAHIFRGVPKVIDYVPSYGVPPSDTWFTVWDTTGALYQNMNISRIPCSDENEFNFYFQKLQNYIARDYDEVNKLYLLFSGGKSDDAAELEQLKNANDSVAARIGKPPVGGKYTHFYKTLDPPTDFGPYTPAEIDEAISNGSVFISYIGHSGVQIWDNSIVDPSQLANDVNMNPLITDFGCSTGRFAEPEIMSFSELFINHPDGQSINYISNSSLGFTSTSTTFPALFYDQILSDSGFTVSESHKRAKTEMLNTFGTSSTYKVFALCNTLFGDPAVKIKIPPKVNFKISSESFKVLDTGYSEKTDSVNLSVIFFNLGRVPDDSVLISIIHTYNSDTVSTTVITRKIPLFADTIYYAIDVLDKPGTHSISAFADKQNLFDELFENDNSFSFNLIVPSVSYRPIIYDLSLNSKMNKINILSPTAGENSASEIIVETDQTEDFSNPTQTVVPIDTFVTPVNTSTLTEDERYYIRVKENSPGGEFSVPVSFFNKEGAAFLIADSSALRKLDVENVEFSDEDGFNIANLKYNIEVFSAGFNDGKIALGIVNGVNYMVESDAIGHHIAVFDETTMEFEYYKRFDLLFGGTPQVEAYKEALDSIPENKIVLFAVCDEGSSRLTTELKDKIKEFGSVLIDSLGWRDSWAMIGERNAPAGSVPEGYHPAFGGILSIDTLIERPNDFGRFVTTEIGPVRQWSLLKIDQSLTNGSEIKVRPIGIKQDDSQDTLSYLILPNNGEADLSSVNPDVYSRMKFVCEFYADPQGISPSINSFGVDFLGLPELGTNYQSVRITRDTLNLGDQTNISFSVFNAGLSDAEDVSLSVGIINSDNSSEIILKDTIQVLKADSSYKVNLNYTAGSGSENRTILISIDQSNLIKEYYEDNNFYSVPVFVFPDTTNPTLNINFDGAPVFDGDFVSPNPEILIELNDPSLLPIQDTSSVSIYLDDKPVYYSENQSILSYEFNSSNPKMIVTFKPVLQDGEHTLRVFAKDASGNFVDSAGVQKIFQVSAAARLLYVYNYPNPFTEETYFTFKLTQIPDRLKIKIYSVAGRLIREIEVPSSALRFDFNKVQWDGRDEDGDKLANGIYFYKIILEKGGEVENTIQKLAIIR